MFYNYSPSHWKTTDLSVLSVLRSCQRWSGTSKQGDRGWGASWSRSSTQWPRPAEDHSAPPSPPQLHSSSSPSVSPPRSSHPTNKTQTPNRTTDELQKDWSSKLQTGVWGVRQRWAGLCTLTYVCVCVFVCSPVQCVGWCLCDRLGHRTSLHMLTWTNMSSDSIWLLWMLVFCCLLDFDFRSLFVLKWRSGKSNEKPGKELHIWSHWQDGPICNEPVEWGSVGHVAPLRMLDFCFVSVFFFFFYKCNQLPTLWSLATCITAEFAQFTETLQRKTI